MIVRNTRTRQGLECVGTGALRLQIDLWNQMERRAVGLSRLEVTVAVFGSWRSSSKVWSSVDAKRITAVANVRTMMALGTENKTFSAPA